MNQKTRQANLNNPFSSQDIPTKIARKDKQRVTKPSTAVNCIHKSKERHSGKYELQHPAFKGTSVTKQLNVESGNSTPTNIIQYSASDESAVVEVTLKTHNAPKQRSKSTVSNREPWGQLLKKQKNKDSESVFGNFDPLRSLHFLSKELQIHIQSLLPDEENIQEIIKAMQMALKRVPPEVASTIHLQQSVGLLPGVRQRYLKYDICEKPDMMENKYVQTHITSEEKSEVKRIQKIMEESTVKLEESCQQLEAVCTQLKNEKLCLEAELQSEKANASFFRKRIEDLENLNKDLSHTLYKKDEQIAHLKLNVEALETKMEQVDLSKTEAKSIMGELKQSKFSLEQECAKLKHQLRLCAIEKEKYLAILAVRDRQIYEIRNEMSHLQEVVNNQLVELHTNIMTTLPSNTDIPADSVANTYSRISPISIHDDKNAIHEPLDDYSDNEHEINNEQMNSKVGGSETNIKIKDMFGELKKQAYALTNLKI